MAYILICLRVSRKKMLYSRTWLYGLLYVGHLSIRDSFPWYAKHLLLCVSPGYVGQLGWAAECPTYTGSTVVHKGVTVMLHVTTCCIPLVYNPIFGCKCQMPHYSFFIKVSNFDAFLP